MLIFLLSSLEQHELEDSNNNENAHSLNNKENIFDKLSDDRFYI